MANDDYDNAKTDKEMLQKLEGKAQRRLATEANKRRQPLPYSVCEVHPQHRTSVIVARFCHSEDAVKYMDAVEGHLDKGSYQVLCMNGRPYKPRQDST